MLGTRLAAGAAGMMQISVGGLYLGPSNLVRRPLPPDQINLVVYIEQAGPVWVLLFALSGAWLITCAVRRQGFVIAHGISVFVWFFYGAAIWFGAAFSEPPTPVLSADIAVFVALLNAALAIGCAERGHR